MIQSLIRPFEALRPTPEYAAEVASRPYDVLTADEARAGAAGRAWSFLHVSRAEVDLPPGIDVHGPEVYAKAGENIARMVDAGVLIRESGPCYYAYRMTMGDHVQTGLAAAGSLAAYESNRIRRHELTRPDKELDRTRQIEAVGAHTGPVMVTHRPDAGVAAILENATVGPASFSATTDEGTLHEVWVISDPAAIAGLTDGFEAMDAIYIADGHHRSAAALRVAEARRSATPPAHGDELYERFLIVSFPADEVLILDYNRGVLDLNGLRPDAFLSGVRAAFELERVDGQARPKRRGSFGMYLDGRWYRLSPREPVPPGSAEGSTAVERLDVSVLADRLLRPILGVGDPRTDPRIDFIGGGRGLGALEDRVNGGRYAVAFALFPTSLEDLMAVADAGEIMPPKSTWFEPKLADGLLSLPLE